MKAHTVSKDLRSLFFFVSCLFVQHLSSLCFCHNITFPLRERQTHKGETVRDYRRPCLQYNHKAHTTYCFSTTNTNTNTPLCFSLCFVFLYLFPCVVLKHVLQHYTLQKKKHTTTQSAQKPSKRPVQIHNSLSHWILSHFSSNT